MVLSGYASWVPRITILNHPFDTIHAEELVKDLISRIKNNQGTQLSFANPEHVLKYNSLPDLRNYTNKSDYILPDGIGIIWASNHLKKFNQGVVLTERITGTDFSEEIAKQCEKHKWRFALYGGTPAAADKAQQNLKKRYPNLTIESLPGHGNSDQDVLNWLETFSPHVLMVCLGNPTQELWIEKNRKALNTIPLVFGNGGAVDFLAGTVKRAPRWMHRFSNLGLEWLWRLFQSFTWKRFTRTLQIPYFMFLVLRKQFLGF